MGGPICDYRPCREARPHHPSPWEGSYGRKRAAVVGNYAYVCRGPALDILDISNPAQTTRTGAVQLPALGQDIQVLNGRAYVANAGGGLVIVDVSTPASPTFLGGYNTSGSALDVYVSGSLAYVADESSGLQIIDVSTGGGDEDSDTGDFTLILTDIPLAGSASFSFEQTDEILSRESLTLAAQDADAILYSPDPTGKRVVTLRRPCIEITPRTASQISVACDTRMMPTEAPVSQFYGRLTRHRTRLPIAEEFWHALRAH